MFLQTFTPIVCDTIKKFPFLIFFVAVEEFSSVWDIILILLEDPDALVRNAISKVRLRDDAYTNRL